MKRLCTILIVATPALASAGSIAVSEFDAIASGRGAAATALYTSPSAIFYNPANITRLDGLQLNAGATALMPRWEYAPIDGAADATTKSNAGVVPPPFLSMSYKLGDQGFGDLSAGLGLYVPYGSAFGWPDDWAGRAEVQEISLQVFEVSPVIAWRPHPAVAVGAGFRFLPSTVYLRQAVEFGAETSGQVEMKGRANGLGASAGLSVWPSEGLSLGFSWRSPVTLRFHGESDFEFPPPFDTEARDRTVDTEIPLAQVYRFGVAYDISPELNVSADVEYQLWSAFEELRIVFTDAAGATEEVASPRDSRNSVTVHTGAEYKIAPKVAVRAGYAYDQKTLPEETVNPAPPDSDRHVVMLGGSYWWDRFGVHAFVGNAFFVKRTALTSDFPGEWRGGWPLGTMAYLAGLSVSAALDVPPAWKGPDMDVKSGQSSPPPADAAAEPAPL